MTPDEIDKLDGRDLDAQVAERVFGWPPSAPEAVLHYSTDPAAMMEVVGRMGELGFHWRQTSPFVPGHSWFAGFTPHGETGWNGRPDFAAHGETAMEATARAALRAVSK